MKNNKNTTKLQRVQFTIQEIWQALRGDVHKSKKKYTRKNKSWKNNINEE
jgi:hypothetical protein